MSDYLEVKTNNGHTIYQFVLDKIKGLVIKKETTGTPIRLETSYERIIRDTKKAGLVKKIYRDTCQVCNTRLSVGDKQYYSEGAHVRPLGRPHDSPDLEGNILCLCPNCHVQFDRYQFSIDSDSLALIGRTGRLTLLEGHGLKSEFLDYHRNQYELYRKIV